MKGDFFTRACILHTVDEHISAARGIPSSKNEGSGQSNIVDFPEDSVFMELFDFGIRASVLGEIYAIFETFEFLQTPSVGEKIRWYAKSDHERVYDLLRSVNLYDHSARVARNALMETSISREQRGLVALFGLLHDIGKSRKFCVHYGVEFGEHERAGAELISAILADTPYEKAGELFAEDLRMIAVAKEDGGFANIGFYGLYMHKADRLAREQELKIIERESRVEEKVQ